jgi:DNA-binding response OmpR family regulator
MSSPAIQLPQSALPLAGRRVLVVEDDPALRGLVGSVVERLGGRAELAAGGARALELAAAHPPDLAVLDVVLPDLHAAEVRRALATGAVLLVSGYRPEDRPEAFAGLEGLPFLAKPFALAELRAELLRLDGAPAAKA